MALLGSGSMHALWITKHGGPSVLAYRESPDPEPGPGDVRIRTVAAGLNFADVSARVGLYPDAPKPPCVVGYECSGTIDAVGEGVDRARIGERVVAVVRFRAQADTVVVPSLQARHVPDALDLVTAAAIPVNYLTAHLALHHIGNLQPGQSVLVHMAAGGVGQAAIQLARLVPDVTIFGTASAGKHEMLREAGVAHPIDYRTRDYVEEVRKATGGRGVDLVLDALGGPDWKKGYSLLAPLGRLVAFGLANAVSGEKRSLVHAGLQLFRSPSFKPFAMMNDNRGVHGLNLGHLWGETARLAALMDELIALWAGGKIAPVIDAKVPMSSAADGHRRLTERKNVGKVLLIPG